MDLGWERCEDGNSYLGIRYQKDSPFNKFMKNMITLVGHVSNASKIDSQGLNATTNILYLCTVICITKFIQIIHLSVAHD